MAKSIFQSQIYLHPKLDRPVGADGTIIRSERWVYILKISELQVIKW